MAVSDVNGVNEEFETPNATSAPNDEEEYQGATMTLVEHLEELRRTASSEFGIAQARTIGQLESLAAEERLFDALIPAGRLLPGMPEIYVDEPTILRIRNGSNFPASPFRGAAAAHRVKAITYGGDLVAIGEAVLPNLYHPVVVL